MGVSLPPNIDRSLSAAILCARTVLDIAMTDTITLAIVRQSEVIRATELPRPLARPLFLCPVRAGFPSPCEDYIDQELDANDLLAPIPAATYYVRVSGQSMHDCYVRDGDIAVVDRSLTPSSGHVVVATLDGEMVIKRLVKTASGGVELHPANSRYPILTVQPDQDFEVWGVVRWTLHNHLGGLP